METVFFVLILAGAAAGPTTRPATTRATTRPHVYHSLREIFAEIPRDALPPAGVRWQSIHNQLVRKWLDAHIPGTVFDTDGRFEGASVREKDGGVSVSVTLASFKFIDLTFESKCSFTLPGEDAARVAKKSRGDHIRFSGTIRSVGVRVQQAQYGEASVSLVDGKLR